jgi:4-hydroxy-tetrahydrodipicolinate synthase
MSLARIRTALRGISGVHVTPYSASSEVDEARLAAIVSRIAGSGVHNIVSAGNTGEFYALTSDEVRRVHATAIAAVGGRALATAGVGRSLREAIATGHAARAAGADCLMAHHPLDPFAAPSAQADYFIAIAEAVDLPLVAYIRSDAMALADLVRVATHANIAGVKFASTNLMLLADCVRATQIHPTVWVCGLAEGWAAPFHAQGARGFTSGLVNVAPELSLSIWRALEAGDQALARHIVSAIAPFEAMRAKFNNGANVTVVKEALALTDRDPGPVRAPGLARLDEADRAQLKEIIASWSRLTLTQPAAA